VNDPAKLLIMFAKSVTHAPKDDVEMICDAVMPFTPLMVSGNLSETSADCKDACMSLKRVMSASYSH